MQVSIGEMAQHDEASIDGNKTVAFNRATGSKNVNTIAPTYCTIFRNGEYELLSRLGVETRYLLHAEQQYDYLAPLKLNQPIQVKTKLVSKKERKTSEVHMLFLTMESDIYCSNALCIQSRTTFVMRKPQAEKSK